MSNEHTLASQLREFIARTTHPGGTALGGALVTALCQAAHVYAAVVISVGELDHVGVW